MTLSFHTQLNIFVLYQLVFPCFQLRIRSRIRDVYLNRIIFKKLHWRLPADEEAIFFNWNEDTGQRKDVFRLLRANGQKFTMVKGYFPGEISRKRQTFVYSIIWSVRSKIKSREFHGFITLDAILRNIDQNHPMFWAEKLQNLLKFDSSVTLIYYAFFVRSPKY